MLAVRGKKKNNKITNYSSDGGMKKTPLLEKLNTILRSLEDKVTLF
jgi:hypothetical protein